jgi:hypothetical protein
MTAPTAAPPSLNAGCRTHSSPVSCPECTELAAVPPKARDAAIRWGCRLGFVRLHWGLHACLDGRTYEANCLITDPSREVEARALMGGAP